MHPGDGAGRCSRATDDVHDTERARGKSAAHTRCESHWTPKEKASSAYDGRVYIEANVERCIASTSKELQSFGCGVGGPYKSVCGPRRSVTSGMVVIYIHRHHNLKLQVDLKLSSERAVSDSKKKVGRESIPVHSFA